MGSLGESSRDAPSVADFSGEIDYIRVNRIFAGPRPLTSLGPGSPGC